MSKDWKDRLGVVYSTNPEFKFDSEKNTETKTLSPDQQNLVVWIERKNRGGKTVTIVKGFIGTETDLNALAKTLKSKCGVGGSAKDGEIIIQGDLKLKVADILKSLNYRTKISG